MSTSHDNPRLPDFVARTATTADLEAIVDLLNTSSANTLGTHITANHWQRRQWQESQLLLAENTRLIIAPHDLVVGYIQVHNSAPYVVNELSGAVHPEFRQRGIGTYLLEWAEQRARQLVPHAPPAAAVFVRSNLFDSNLPALDLYHRHDYEEARRFIHLRIDMATPPSEPKWPNGIAVKHIAPEGWPEVVAALELAFQDHWGEIDEQSRAALTPGRTLSPDPESEQVAKNSQSKDVFDKAYFNTPGLCFAVIAGDAVVGSCLCNARSVEFANAGRLGSLSVLPSWRRKGIGLALTFNALAEFYRRDIRSVLTDTDSRSFTGANFLYPQAGMSVFRSELVYEKMIRSGQDLLRREVSSTS